MSHIEGSGGPQFDIIALGSSAGGLVARSQLLSGLPADLPVLIVVVQHLDPRHRSLMASILDRRSDLVVKEAADGDKLVPGVVYVAPPNRHLLVNSDRTLSLSPMTSLRSPRPSTRP
jgi:two-component system chemotaxis response regulator CheB